MNIKLLLLAFLFFLILPYASVVRGQDDPNLPVAEGMPAAPVTAENTVVENTMENTAVENTAVEETPPDQVIPPQTNDGNAGMEDNTTNMNGNVNGNVNTNVNTNGGTGTGTGDGTGNGNGKAGGGGQVIIEGEGEEDEDALEGQLDTIVNTNTTLDECGTTSSQLGMFSFYRPISKSILVLHSNFTIIWYYNNLMNEVYTYPTEYITLSLFYEEDANPNSWASSWKKPVWEKVIPMGEVEAGPTLTNNVPSYQWDWKILYDGKTGQPSSEGVYQTLRTNEKYRLRISGDGKDLQRNSALQCYREGDIMPGVTRSFYMVENIALPTYEPFAIPDGARPRVMRPSLSVWTGHPWTSLLSLLMALALTYLLI